MRINNLSSGTNFGYKINENAKINMRNLNQGNTDELIRELENTGNDNTYINTYINKQGHLTFYVNPKNCSYRILDIDDIYNPKTKQFNKENFVSEVQAMEKDSIIGRLINSTYNGQLNETSTKCIEDFPHLTNLIKNIATNSSYLQLNDEIKARKELEHEIAIRRYNKLPFFKKIFTKKS